MDEEDPPSFPDAQSEARYYRLQARELRDRFEETQAALDEFQASSKELEAELERDLAMTEKRENELRGKCEVLGGEVEEWRTRFQSSLHEHTKTMAHMQAEIESLRKSEENYRKKLRDMELDNDVLENSERAMTSTLQDLETRYGKAIERTALLEEEIVTKARLEEENQRLKDELRDLNEEVSVMREQRASLQPAPPRPFTPPGSIGSLNSTRGYAPSNNSDGGRPSSVSEPEDQATPRRSAPTSSRTNGQTPRQPSISYLAASPSRIPSPSSVRPTVTSPVGDTSPTRIPNNNRNSAGPGSLGIPSSLSRSTNTRNLSALTNTPKATGVEAGTGGKSEKKPGAMTENLKEMTSRYKSLTANINSRRNLIQSSSIPRVSRFGGGTSTSTSTSTTSTTTTTGSGAGTNLTRSRSQRAAVSSAPGAGNSLSRTAQTARTALGPTTILSRTQRGGSVDQTASSSSALGSTARRPNSVTSERGPGRPPSRLASLNLDNKTDLDNVEDFGTGPKSARLPPSRPETPRYESLTSPADQQFTDSDDYISTIFDLFTLESAEPGRSKLGKSTYGVSVARRKSIANPGGASYGFGSGSSTGRIPAMSSATTTTTAKSRPSSTISNSAGADALPLPSTTQTSSKSNGRESLGSDMLTKSFGWNGAGTTSRRQSSAGGDAGSRIPSRTPSRASSRAGSRAGSSLGTYAQQPALVASDDGLAGDYDETETF